MRFGILIIAIVISLSIVRYPFAVQNFMRADGLLALGLIDQAIVHYQKATVLYPEFDQAYSMLAWSYEMKQDFIRAECTYEKGLRPVRKHDENLLYLHYILFLWKRNSNEKALVIAREAYDAFPGDRNIMRVYGHSLEKNGNNEEAEKLWRQYLKHYPLDESTRKRLEALEKKK